jgi:hypothetical protein
LNAPEPLSLINVTLLKHKCNLTENFVLHVLNCTILHLIAFKAIKGKQCGSKGLTLQPRMLSSKISISLKKINFES